MPRPLRLGVSLQMARARSAWLHRRLGGLAADRRPILAGPWLGEVGFELLYWVPFLRWFAEDFGVPPERLVVVSRGGTSSWYQPFAARYHDVLELVTVAELRAQHDRRVRELGEQKQTRMTTFERRVLGEVGRRIGAADAPVLHPSAMYHLMNPFWWRHLDEGWVHHHTRYRRLTRPDPGESAAIPAPYVAAKFYFNECFPATAQNRAFVRSLVRAVAAKRTVVSLDTGPSVDDHDALALEGEGVVTPALHVAPERNLALQSAIVAGASAFIGTYGGFAYLAPFYRVRSCAFYSDAAGFSLRHLSMARSALAWMGADDLLEVRPADRVPPLLDLD